MAFIHGILYLAFTSALGTLPVKELLISIIATIFHLSFEDLVILRNLSVLKVHFYLLFFFFFTYFCSPSWGLSLHEVIYIKLVCINRLVRSLQSVSWFDMGYLQKKNKLLEEEGCVYGKVQSNFCTFRAYILRIIPITETVLYQISGLFVAPGGQ